MIDTSGNQVGTTMTYYPYGSARSGSVPTDKKFTGQRLDGTGLYYYGARYYDPSIGRFISADTIVQAPNNPQSLNRYSYVINNPLAYTDSTGNCWGPARNLPGCGVARNVAKKVKDLAVDSGKAVVQTVETAKETVAGPTRAAGHAVSEAGQWAVGIEEVTTVETKTGVAFTNVVAQESGLNIVNRTIDVFGLGRAESIAIGGPFGVWSTEPLGEQRIEHEGQHAREQNEKGRWTGWLEWHFDYQLEYWSTFFFLYGDLDKAYEFHSAENRAREAAHEPTSELRWDDYWWWP